MVLFKLGEEVDHRADDRECPECCEGYPEPCRCGGLIHAAAGEIDAEGNPMLLTECDHCGRSEESEEQEP
jgi:hypothetical protein